MPRQIPQRHVDGADAEVTIPPRRSIGRLAEFDQIASTSRGSRPMSRGQAPLHDHLHGGGGVFRPGDSSPSRRPLASPADQRDVAGLALVVRIARGGFRPGRSSPGHRKSPAFRPAWSGLCARTSHRRIARSHPQRGRRAVAALAHPPRLSPRQSICLGRRAGQPVDSPSGPNRDPH